MPMKRGTSEDSIEHPGDLVVSDNVIDRLRASTHKDRRDREKYERKENYEKRLHQAEGYMRRYTQVIDNAISRNLNSLENKLNIPEVCKKERDSLKNCYNVNSNQTLKCNTEVEEYLNCVKINRQKMDKESVVRIKK